MFRNISFVSFAFLYTYAIGYIFHFFVSRKLGPAGYGEFMVLNSLFLTVGNAAGILSTVTVKAIIENESFRYEILRFFRYFSLLIGSILFIIGVVFSPFLKEFLNLSYIPYIWLIAISWIFLLFNAVERAFLQANGQFGYYSVSSVIELTLKLFLALFFLYMGLYIGGVVLGILLSLLIVSLFLVSINGHIFGKIKFINLRDILKTGIYASPAGFLMYADDIFIRRIFDPQMAGLFASASIVGKAFLGLCIMLLTVFFPHFVREKNISNIKGFFYRYLALVLLIFFVGEISLLLFGKKLFLVLFGSKFIQGFEILRFYLLSILPISILVGLIYVFIASNRGIFIIYSHLVVYYLGFLLISFDNTEKYLLYIFLANLCFLFIYMAYLYDKLPWNDKIFTLK